MEPVKVINGLDELAVEVGRQLGPTEWMVVEQHRVDDFAGATEDRQWIHVDTVRASEGPFGRTVVHGLLTLSLLPHFMQQLYRVDGVAMAINYGYNKVRFVAPVPVGAKIRAAATIDSVGAVPGGVQATVATVIEIEGSAKPAATIESIVRYLK